MAKKKIYEINRKEYDKIRKMDRNSMQQYMAGVFESGLAAGEKAAGSFDMNICLAAVSEIKGIGPAKIEQIRLAMIAAGAKE